MGCISDILLLNENLKFNLFKSRILLMTRLQLVPVNL